MFQSIVAIILLMPIFSTFSHGVSLKLLWCPFDTSPFDTKYSDVFPCFLYKNMQQIYYVYFLTWIWNYIFLQGVLIVVWFLETIIWAVVMGFFGVFITSELFQWEELENTFFLKKEYGLIMIFIIQNLKCRFLPNNMFIFSLSIECLSSE